jgi:outer membrane protein assembly factor BamD
VPPDDLTWGRSPWRGAEMKMKTLSALCIFIFLITCSGCALLDMLFEEEPEGSAQELAWEGMESYQDGDYERAIQAFERLKDWYPFSKFAVLAELKLADAYYQVGQYEDAIFAYEEFENLHPQNEAVPYVVYQIGMCHFQQTDSIDRDQSATRKALDVFIRLREQFPESEYAVKAEEKIKLCFKNLARHELYVALFYYNSNHYKAALGRFKGILTKYPDVGLHQTAIRYIPLCEAKIAEEQKRKAEGGFEIKRYLPFTSTSYYR